MDASEEFAIRNSYTNRLLIRQPHDDGSAALMVAPPGPKLDDARWRIESVESDNLLRISDPSTPRSYLHLDSGQVTMKRTQPRDLGSLWLSVPVGDTDYVRLRSRAYPDAYLNIEHGGVLGAGPVEPGWMSAMWALDEKRVRWGYDGHERPATVFVEDARSVSLNYAGDDVASMYIEVTPTDSQRGTYFMAIGFLGGYLGMQELGDGSFVARFSVWDNDGQETTWRGPADVPSAEFPPEGGTGTSATRPMSSFVNETVSFVVSAEAAGSSTQFSAWFNIPSARGWQSMGTFTRPATGGRLLRGLNSFVEDFLRNGATEGVEAAKRSPYQHHVATYSNPWTFATDGTGTALRQATLNAFSGEPNNPLENVDGTVVDGDVVAFQLATGGFWVAHNKPGTVLESDAEASAEPALPDAESADEDTATVE